VRLKRTHSRRFPYLQPVYNRLCVSGWEFIPSLLAGVLRMNSQAGTSSAFQTHFPYQHWNEFQCGRPGEPLYPDYFLNLHQSLAPGYFADPRLTKTGYPPFPAFPPSPTPPPAGPHLTRIRPSQQQLSRLHQRLKPAWRGHDDHTRHAGDPALFFIQLPHFDTLAGLSSFKIRERNTLGSATRSRLHICCN
jgi:hypothetical protein